MSYFYIEILTTNQSKLLHTGISSKQSDMSTTREINNLYIFNVCSPFKKNIIRVFISKFRDIN